MKPYILEVLLHLSSEREQLESWFGTTQSVYSPFEAVMSLEDAQFKEWLDDDTLSEIAKSAVSCVLRCINDLPDLDDPVEAFSSLEWIRLRLAASVAHELLKSELD